MKRTAADVFAVVIGAFLLIEGVWGFFSPVVFGILTTNTLHAIIHVILGITGIMLGYRDKARGFCWFLGGLLLVVGVLRFIPGANQIVIDLLNVNDAVGIMNIVIGLMGLAAAALSSKKAMASTFDNRPSTS